MIRVEPRLLPTYHGKDLMESISTQAANAAVKEFAKGIEPKLKGLKCEKHPNMSSTLRLVADKKLLVKVEKNSFCCQDFANSVSVNVKR